jgi:DNA-binding NarL/FixJ family response regulator
VRVVAIGVTADEETILACAAIGVQGYVCRAASLADLRKALQNTSGDGPWCDERVSAFVMQCMSGICKRLNEAAVPAARCAAVQLTRREMQVARLMSEGLMNKEIADRLSVEVCTVKNHVHNVLSKLGARSRAEATHILMARQAG